MAAAMKLGSPRMPSAAISSLIDCNMIPAPACGLNGGLSRTERAHPRVGRLAGVLVFPTLGVFDGVHLRVDLAPLNSATGQARMFMGLSSRVRSRCCEARPSTAIASLLSSNYHPIAKVYPCHCACIRVFIWHEHEHEYVYNVTRYLASPLTFPDREISQTQSLRGSAGFRGFVEVGPIWALTWREYVSTATRFPRSSAARAIARWRQAG